MIITLITVVLINIINFYRHIYYHYYYFIFSITIIFSNIIVYIFTFVIISINGMLIAINTARTVEIPRNKQAKQRGSLFFLSHTSPSAFRLPVPFSRFTPPSYIQIFLQFSPPLPLKDLHLPLNFPLSLNSRTSYNHLHPSSVSHLRYFPPFHSSLPILYTISL